MPVRTMRPYRLGLDVPPLSQAMARADDPRGGRLCRGRPPVQPITVSRFRRLFHVQFRKRLQPYSDLAIRDRRGLAPSAIRHRPRRLAPAVVDEPEHG